jgi:WD40 repeat protein
VQIAFAPDGKTLASVRNDRNGAVQIWSVPDGKLLKWWAHPGPWPAGGLSYSPDGRWLATFGGNDVFLWEVDRGHGRVLPLIPDGMFCAAVAFSPAGDTLAVACHPPAPSEGGCRVLVWPIAVVSAEAVERPVLKD